MAVPDFQSMMLPILKLFGDSKPHTNEEALKRTIDEFQLSEKEINEKLPSGRQTRLGNRVAWALVHLTAAELLQQQARGLRAITERGLGTLASPPDRISLKYLSQFPEFVAFRSGGRTDNDSSETEDDESTTPDEDLEAAFERAQNPKRQEVLAAILEKSPEFFERLVLDVLNGIGYGGSVDESLTHLGRAGDGGVDGVIKEDALGLELVYVQAKRYDPSNSVGRQDIQQFAGSLEGFRARKGVFITTSSFTSGAREYANLIEKRIALIDGNELVDLMLKADVGVRTVRTYELKAIDQDYFSEP